MTRRLPTPLELVRLDDAEVTELEHLLGELVAERPGRAWEAARGVRSLELLEQLATTGARQARLGAGGKRSAPAHESAVPFVDDPLTVREQLAGLLATWAAVTMRADAAEAPIGPRRAAPRTLNPEDTAAWLLDRVPTLAWRPGATRPRLDELRRLYRRGRALIDRRPDRWYAGPCATPLRDADGSLVIADGEQAYCEVDLYVRPHVPLAVCPSCGARHRVEARRTELLDLARGHAMRAVDLARAVTGLGVDVTPERIRQWKRRGLLEVTGLTDDGQPTYLVGQVLDLVTAQATRPPRQRKARAA